MALTRRASLLETLFRRVSRRPLVLRSERRWKHVMPRWPGNAEHQRTPFGQLSRSELMARVRSRGNASTELRLASLLRLYRIVGWRRHQPFLGNPDFVWRGQRVALFVDGCYWHAHGCKRNLSPRTNVAMWQLKFTSNMKRDRRVNRELRARGWTVIRLWECELAEVPDRCIRRIERALLRRVPRTSRLTA